MQWVFYLYYRLFLYYKSAKDPSSASFSSYLALTGLIWFNFCSLDFWLGFIFFDGEFLMSHILVYETNINKFVITPLFLIPIYGILYLSINKKVEQKFEVFEKESVDDFKRKGLIVKIYVIGSILLIFLMIFSPFFS